MTSMIAWKMPFPVGFDFTAIIVVVCGLLNEIRQRT